MYQESNMKKANFARASIDWVSSVLESYKSRSLQEFTIAVLVDKLNQHEVTKWLEFAFSRRVMTLKLISNELWANAGVLAEMLKDTSISSSDFKSLKLLRLKPIKMSSYAIEFFLQNCPLLERLVLDTLTVTSDLEVGGLLKHLIGYALGDEQELGQSICPEYHLAHRRQWHEESVLGVCTETHEHDILLQIKLWGHNVWFCESSS